MRALEFNSHILTIEKQLKIYAYRLTSNKEEALDLYQDTVLKALLNQTKFSHNNLKAWTFTIMKNLFINSYRRKLKQREWLSNETKVKRGVMNLSYENPVSYQYHQDILKELSLLEECIRKPLEMFIQGFKYREIADQLDLPIGTIKSRIFHGRRILMRKLSEFAT